LSFVFIEGRKLCQQPSGRNKRTSQQLVKSKKQKFNLMSVFFHHKVSYTRSSWNLI